MYIARKAFGWCSLLVLVAAFLLPERTVLAPPSSGNVCVAVESPSPFATPSYEETRAALLNPWGIRPVHTGNIDAETLWLARAMFSESKRPDEQELVGWVVRNRVESEHRGCNSYRSCVLDPFQFSAFIESYPTANYYIGLDLSPSSLRIPGWKKALALAYHIRHADDQLRPFPPTVLHFFSEQSLMDPEVLPEWVKDWTPITPARDFQLDEGRFRFYSGIP